MKTLYKIGWNELINAAVNNGYELIDSVVGCLIDSVLYIKPETETTQAILLAGFDTYLNEWSSCLTVYIARTEKDRDKLYKKWESFKAAQETEETTA